MSPASPGLGAPVGRDPTGGGPAGAGGSPGPLSSDGSRTLCEAGATPRLFQNFSLLFGPHCCFPAIVPRFKSKRSRGPFEAGLRREVTHTRTPNRCHESSTQGWAAPRAAGIPAGVGAAPDTGPPRDRAGLGEAPAAWVQGLVSAPLNPQAQKPLAVTGGASPEPPVPENLLHWGRVAAPSSPQLGSRQTPRVSIWGAGVGRAEGHRPGT